MPDHVTQFEPVEVAGAVASMIQSGEMDVWLDQIERYIVARKQYQAKLRVASIKVGDVIALSDKITPKLLAGIECEVIDFEPDFHVKVKLLQHGSSKWRLGGVVTISAGLVGRTVRTAPKKED